MVRGAQVSEWIGRNSQRKETLVKKGERTKGKKWGSAEDERSASTGKIAWPNFFCLLHNRLNELIHKNFKYRATGQAKLWNTENFSLEPQQVGTAKTRNQSKRHRPLCSCASLYYMSRIVRDSSLRTSAHC